MNEPWKGLAVREEGGVSWVTIDRVEDRNSLDSETISELGRHLEAAEKADGRAIVYRGAGGTHFIGGADGVEMFEMAPEEARGFSRRIHELFTQMESSRLFLVAAIDGLCFGGGLEFALACEVTEIPRYAFVAAKQALHASRNLPLPQGLAVESDRFAECFREPYFADRVREQLADGRLTTTRRRKGERKADEHVDA
ncbi:MAG: enoyl-CoA hydratase/isomerase family protein [Candidatus Bipolaricaulota bacterium]|nr:enoyl-CoA hydratase/isomerase family protein [Candidatus Bipolaricaulota bacterium]